MIRKRGKMDQPVKNGTQYKKCTLATLISSFSGEHLEITTVLDLVIRVCAYSYATFSVLCKQTCFAFSLDIIDRLYLLYYTVFHKKKPIIPDLEIHESIYVNYHSKSRI